MWKFRTMVPNADRIGPLITVKSDPRITPFGRLLRQTKLDELPQFFNLLLGDMALVGPRPEVPEIVNLYDAEQRRVLSVQPGITGPVQLSWADEAEGIPEGDRESRYYVENVMHRKLEADLQYLANRTSRTDACVLWNTARLVIRRIVSTPLRYRTRGDTSAA